MWQVSRESFFWRIEQGAKRCGYRATPPEEMIKLIVLALSHAVVGIVGSAGIYVLPILTAPASPAAAELQSLEASARDLRGGDFLHWGEGIVAVGETSVSLRGKLAPGPDYKAYLSPEYVEEAEFQAAKSRAERLGDVKNK
jgi:hypothetical protein